VTRVCSSSVAFDYSTGAGKPCGVKNAGPTGAVVRPGLGKSAAGGASADRYASLHVIAALAVHSTDRRIAMTLRFALTLLLVVALLTPLAAMLGLYETSMEQLFAFVAPVLGAAGAIAVTRFATRRTR